VRWLEGRSFTHTSVVHVSEERAEDHCQSDNEGGNEEEVCDRVGRRHRDPAQVYRFSEGRGALFPRGDSALGRAVAMGEIGDTVTAIVASVKKSEGRVKA
jgi:hypothetical protein